MLTLVSAHQRTREAPRAPPLPLKLPVFIWAAADWIKRLKKKTFQGVEPFVNRTHRPRARSQRQSNIRRVADGESEKSRAASTEHTTWRGTERNGGRGLKMCHLYLH